MNNIVGEEEFRLRAAMIAHKEDIVELSKSISSDSLDFLTLLGEDGFLISDGIVNVEITLC